MRTVLWHVEIDGRDYMVIAQTEASAVRKALTEHRNDTQGGQQLRLGQGFCFIRFRRTHRREMKSWQEKGNKVLK